MPLKTNFSCDTVKSLVCEVQIHASFGHAEIVRSDTLEFVMFLLYTKLSVVSFVNTIMELRIMRLPIMDGNPSYANPAVNASNDLNLVIVNTEDGLGKLGFFKHDCTYYWLSGTTLPLWDGAVSKEIIIIVSVSNLAQVSGVMTATLHCHKIAHITIHPSSNLVFRSIVYEFVGWLGNKFKENVYLHYPVANAEWFAQNFYGHFEVARPDQTCGYRFCTARFLATVLNSCNNHLVSDHVSEATANCLTQCRKFVHCSSDILIVTILGEGSVVAAQNLKCESEKDIRKVISQTTVLPPATVHQHVTGPNCCYFNFGSITLVLFESLTNSTLEMQSPQYIKPYLDLDWHAKLVFTAETSTGAFFLYEIPSPILCQIIKFICILSKDELYVITARLELLCCVVISVLQWYWNIQCLRFINFENVRGKPLDVITLLMGKERISVSYKLALWFKKRTVMSSHSKNWDPGGDDCSIHTNSSSQFKQWDPGKLFLYFGKVQLILGAALDNTIDYIKACHNSFGARFSSVNWEDLPNLDAIWIYTIITLQQCFSFNLEDKVDFKGDGNVMSLRVRRGIMGNRNMDPYKYEKNQGNKHGTCVMSTFFS